MRHRVFKSAAFWRAALLAAALGALAVVPTAWLASAPSICVFWNLFGVHCPGCGMTRAFSALLHADLAAALAYNKLVLLMFPMVCGIILRDACRLASGRQVRGASPDGTRAATKNN